MIFPVLLAIWSVVGFVIWVTAYECSTLSWSKKQCAFSLLVAGPAMWAAGLFTAAFYPVALLFDYLCKQYMKVWNSLE